MVSALLVIGGLLLSAAGTLLYIEMDMRQWRGCRLNSESTKSAEFDMWRLGPVFLVALGIVLFLNGTQLI